MIFQLQSVRISKTVNVRNETIVATVPSMTRAFSGQGLDAVVFPVYTDGPNQGTQFFLLNRGDAERTTFRFHGSGGEDLSVLLR